MVSSLFFIFNRKFFAKATEAKNKAELSISQRQAIINLIEKKIETKDT